MILILVRRTPTSQFAADVRRVESLQARADESARQVEGLFQSLLAQSFSEGLSQSFE